MQPTHDLVIVIDFGAQYAQLIARRVREAGVYSEIMPSTATAAQIMARNPKAIVLSGGPQSVYAEGSPHIDPAIFTMGIPMLGICYGFQEMASVLGGTVAQTGLSEFGRTPLAIDKVGTLLARSPEVGNVWMSHGDSVTQAPDGFAALAHTDGATVAAFEDLDRRFAGVQWHPEVMHSQIGQQVIEAFLLDIAQCSPTWVASSIVAQAIADVREQVGDKKVLCALSGGVDSMVAAAIVQKAIGDQLTCVYVDHGLQRKGESEQVEKDFVEITGAKLVVKDVSERFLAKLAGVTDPETKRKTIGNEFIRVFEDTAREIADVDGIDFLVQGTLYPDVVESGGGEGAANIKSHHNVGGLPDDMTFQLIEPLRTLFKDEVRAAGLELGLPEKLVYRHPFPGPGLGIRIVGEVTKERLDILREADWIARDELTKAGLDRSIWQFPVVLLADVHSVGVQGDGRTYGMPVVLRPVTSEDAMTADWGRLPYEVIEKMSTRITNEVRDINRVVVDVTSKPPATIEWE
ncbi:MAG: glutamine-hydrolyzing GMP synthase [Propionibacteriaceae bacterium]